MKCMYKRARRRAVYAERRGLGGLWTTHSLRVAALFVGFILGEGGCSLWDLTKYNNTK